ncbi:MAG: hypothetical protein CMP14_10790 [Rickettsiales bacterium]|nr:hypothetical protein [Rickettsiales bacterium]
MTGDERTGRSTLEPIRAQLIRYCRDKKHRGASFNKENPTRWHPKDVIDPRSRLAVPFGKNEEWSFIAETLEQGHEIEEIELRIPAGKKGYVIKISVEHELSPIYIKLQLGGRGVMGRSFHYSEPRREFV